MRIYKTLCWLECHAELLDGRCPFHVVPLLVCMLEIRQAALHNLERRGAAKLLGMKHVVRCGNELHHIAQPQDGAVSEWIEIDGAGRAGHRRNEMAWKPDSTDVQSQTLADKHVEHCEGDRQSQTAIDDAIQKAIFRVVVVALIAAEAE